MNAQTTKQSIHVLCTQIHKCCSNGLSLLEWTLLLTIYVYVKRLRCNAKACILVPSLALSLYVFVCLRCATGSLILNGQIRYENPIGFSVRANTSISECGSLCIFSVLFLVTVIIQLWMETSTIRWHSSFYWNLHIFYLHFVIVNTRCGCVYDIAVPMGKRLLILK